MVGNANLSLTLVKHWALCLTSLTGSGICKVTNTHSRVSEIAMEVQRILDAGVIIQVEAGEKCNLLSRRFTGEQESVVWLL